MTTTDVEDVESFRARARTWIRANLRPRSGGHGSRLVRGSTDREQELAEVSHERALQRALFDAGLAGICVPTAYGGQGLTPAHQRALNEEIVGYEFPDRMQVPTMNPCLAVLLQFGTGEQKLRHVPAILKGEELWLQFLSEPSGGSDVAGALTTAVRDGDEWVLNGSKIWTTGAWWSDWGLCLARTNWDVPKHRGLSVFIFPIRQPSIEIQQIEMLNGAMDFCQEFLTDLRVPDTDRIGEVDQGWAIGTRWMFFEKLLFNSPYVTHPAGVQRVAMGAGIRRIMRDAGRADDPRARALVGEARMLDVVGDALASRTTQGLRSGTLPDNYTAIARLFSGHVGVRSRTIGLEVAGPLGAAASDADGEAAFAGVEFLMRQTSCIGGGTTEMARNVVSERLLGMPREPNLDRDVPFRDVPRSRSRS